MNCSPPGSSIQGILQAGRNTRLCCHFLLQEIFVGSLPNKHPPVECSSFTVVHGREEHSQPRRYFFPILEGVQKVGWIFNKYLLKKVKI